MTILNPPSQFFAKKLANMILHQFNQPNRKYYKKDFKLTLRTNKGKKTFILEKKA